MSPLDKRFDLESKLGLFSERFKGVAVPKTFMKNMENSEDFFDSEIKRRSHAKIGGKLISAISKVSKKAENSKTYKEELERREILNNLFRGVYYVYDEAEKYFKGCKGIDKIKKYNKKIQTQYKKLLSKGYIEEPAKDPNKSNFFKKEEYDLSFAKPDSIPSAAILEDFIGKDAKNLGGIMISFPKFDQNANYKTRCELLYSYLQTFFSTYLFMIKPREKETPKQGENTWEYKPELLPLGTRTKFQDAMDTLEDSLNSYEDCVKKFNEEFAKHKIYFNSGNNKKEIRDIRHSIKTTRGYLQTMLSTGRRVKLDAEFATLNDDVKGEYKSLMDSLTSINVKINAISKFIAKGEYDKFERNYEEIVKVLNELPPLVKDFKRASYKEESSIQKELSEYEANVEKLSADAGAMNEKVKHFTKEFAFAYDDFKKQVVTIAAASAAGGVLSLAMSFVPFAGSAGGAFNTFTNDFKLLCRSSHLPGINP